MTTTTMMLVIMLTNSLKTICSFLCCTGQNRVVQNQDDAVDPREHAAAGHVHCAVTGEEGARARARLTPEVSGRPFAPPTPPTNLAHQHHTEPEKTGFRTTLYHIHRWLLHTSLARSPRQLGTSKIRFSTVRSPRFPFDLALKNNVTNSNPSRRHRGNALSCTKWRMQGSFNSSSSRLLNVQP